MKRHATDDVDTPDRTLCGRPPVNVDNANPTCRTCLRIIEARIKRETN